MWMLYQEYENQQAGAYANYELGAYGQFGTPAAEREYKKVSGLLHTSFITEAVALAVAGMATASVANSVITRIRRATFLVSLLGGPIGAIIGFIIREGAVLGVMWLLRRENFWEGLFQYMLNWDEVMEFMVAGEDAIPSAAASAADTVLDNQTTRALRVDLDYARDMNPQRQVRDRATASQQGTGTAGQRAQDRSAPQQQRPGQQPSGNRFTDLPAFAN